MPRVGHLGPDPVNLRRRDGRPYVVGHRGAPLLAPGNTPASFEAAVASGADLVELDVGRGLAVGHSRQERRRGGARLGDILDLLGPLGAGIQIDLKGGRIERRVVEEVRARGLEDRVLVSSNGIRSLRRLRRLEPRIATGLGYPSDRLGVRNWTWPAGLQRAIVSAGRALLVRRVPGMLSRSKADVVMVNHNLVTADAVAAAHRRGAAFFTWTVNDPATVAALAGLEVDGITTDDPGMALAALATLASP